MNDYIHSEFLEGYKQSFCKGYIHAIEIECPCCRKFTLAPRNHLFLEQLYIDHDNWVGKVELHCIKCGKKISLIKVEPLSSVMNSEFYAKEIS